MTIRKMMEVEVRVDGQGEVTLLFNSMRGGERERDTDGSSLCFGISLAQDAASLSELIRNLARWITKQAVKELQSQQTEVYRVTALPGSARKPR